jgi:hypothetical protein
MTDIYSTHNVGRPFIKPNYKAILLGLEREGKIKTEPPAEKRKKNTFADHVMVTFPRKR